MNKKTRLRKPVVLVLGAAIIAAAWLVSGPDMLNGWGLTGRIVDVLVNGPVILLFFWMVSKNRGFMSCEYRTWNRILGK